MVIFFTPKPTFHDNSISTLAFFWLVHFFCIISPIISFNLFVSLKYCQSVSSVAKSCPTLCNPMDAARQASLSITNSWILLKLMSIKSVMPSNHLIPSSPSPPALNLSQHQGLFKWVSSSHQVAKVVEFQFQHQSFQWTPRTDRSPLGWTGWISLQSKGLSRVFSNTTVKHQFFSAQLSL